MRSVCSAASPERRECREQLLSPIHYELQHEQFHLLFLEVVLGQVGCSHVGNKTNKIRRACHRSCLVQKQAVRVAATEETQRNNGVFSYVSGSLQHTKIRDSILLQTQDYLLFAKRLEYPEKFTPTKTKQLLLFKIRV